MRPIVVTEFITADGIVDSPGGGDHPHAGWTFKDVDFDAAVGIAGLITPVPGGVGPMTIAMLLSNTLAAARGRAGRDVG